MLIIEAAGRRPGAEDFVPVNARVLGGLLVVSLLLNVAGLVFFLSFINLKGQYKTVKRQRTEFEHSLNVIKSNAMMSALPERELYKRTFISQVDGEPDVFAVIPPSTDTYSTDLTLVVYLHGMGSNWMEPFTSPAGEPIADAITARDRSAVFLSCSYRREASWGNDLAMSDISQNIREVCAQFPVKHIIMMGTSMGGCTALSYAEQAPPDLKEKIVGIVSVESAGDLSDLFRESHHPMIKPALITAFGGTPDQVPNSYKKKSFLDNLDQLPKNIRVAVVSARGDDIVPPQLQKKVVAALDNLHVPVRLIEIDGRHGAPAATVYMEALDFAKPGKVAAYVQ